MKEIKVAYIGGGSKNWAQKYFSDFLLQDKLCGEIRLYDIDETAANLNKKYFDRMVIYNKDKILSKWECIVEPNIDLALAGVDVVLISILPYTLYNMKNDVHYPEKYGIYQSVGDTTGPGGYSRAMRTLGTFKFFASKIRENCKDAWVINYTNPLAMCLNMLYKEFEAVKAFGCCHEVFGTQKIIASIMGLYNSLSDNGKIAFMNSDIVTVKKECKKQGKRFENIDNWKGIDRREIIVNVLGINHFTVVDSMSYQGKDIMDIYKAYIKLFRLNNKNRLGKFVPSILKWYRNKENIKFEVLEQYGVAGAAGDRHLAEFLPHKYLPLNKKNVLPYGFWLTPVWLRLYKDKKRKKHLNRAINSKEKIGVSNSGEEGVSQLTALFGLQDLTTNVNMINKGQAPSLPLGATVETNAKFLHDKIECVSSGTIANEELAQIEYLHALNQKEFVDAYYNMDKLGLLKVFLKDPSVARIGTQNGTKLFYEMIELNKETLDGWLLKG